MRIIFGKNDYLIKSVSAEELGINNPQYQELSFELRQEYFHLFFIPTFSLGQSWYINKNGILHHITPTLLEILEERYKYKLQYGAFTFPILLFIFAFCFWSYNVLNNYRISQINDKEIKTERDKLKQAFNHIDTNSVLVFDYGIYYKIAATQKDSLLIALLDKNIIIPDTTIDLDNLYEISNIYLYAILGKRSKPIWVSKNDIIESYKNEEDVNKLIDTEPLSFSEYHTIDNANFIENTNPYAKSIYYFEIQNIGLDIYIDSIVSLDINNDWHLSKEKNIKFLDKFAIKTKEGEKAKLYYRTTKNNKPHSVILKIYNGILYFNY